MKCIASVMMFLVLAGNGFALGPEDGAFGPGQVIADEIRSISNADFAFVPGGILKTSASRSAELGDYLAVADEKIVVVKLTGDLIFSALERSVSMLPSSNPSFLQISGLKVVYNPSAILDRVVKVESDFGSFEKSKVYKVAMPETMAKGGFGFFTIWDNKAISETLDTTLGEVVKNKKYFSSAARYVIKSSF